jgi:hypothetical protein
MLLSTTGRDNGKTKKKSRTGENLFGKDRGNMQSTRIYATAAIAALSVVTTAATPKVTHAQTTYTATVLGQGRVSGASGVFQVGMLFDRASLWQGSEISRIDLSPTVFTYSEAFGVSGNTQVGRAYNNINGATDSHAFLWHGTSSSGVNLHPAGFSASTARGVFGNIQVGYGYPINTGSPHALLWTGSATSVVDLTPPIFTTSAAFGISGNNQVGFCGLVNTSITYAYLWHGTAASAVNLNPAGANWGSSAFAVSGNTQVGTVNVANNTPHAFLWHGTATSALDLNPNGYVYSEAWAVSERGQVGYVANTLDSFGGEAYVWHDSASSGVNLNGFLAGLRDTNNTPLNLTSSRATGIDEFDRVVGYAMPSSTNTTYGVIWTPVTTPTLTSIAPFAALLNTTTPSLSITINGTGFLLGDTVQFNRNTVAATPLSATQIVATVPIDVTGTFPIRVVRGTTVTNTINFGVYRPATATCTNGSYTPGIGRVLPKITTTLVNTGDVAAINLRGLSGNLYNAQNVLVATLTGTPSAITIPINGSVTVNYPLSSTLPNGTYKFTPSGFFTHNGFRDVGSVTGGTKVTVP